MSIPFIHLRSQSSYSLSESTLKISKLVKLAKENNMPAIALTDNNNMFGILEFSLECQQNGIQPIIGTTINLIDFTFKDQTSQLSLLVINEQGYKNLLYLSSKSHLDQKNNTIGLKLDEILKYSEGLICFIGGEFNPLLHLHLQNNDHKIDSFIKKIHNKFENNLFFELQRIEDNLIDEFETKFIKLSQKFNIPLIGSNNIKFEKKEDHSAHDALLCISQKSTVNQVNRVRSNPNIFFKNTEELSILFKDMPQIIDNNLKVAIKCKYYPKEITPSLPKYIEDTNINEEEYLIRLANEGLNLRLYDYETHIKKDYKSRLDYELEIINKMGFAGYFLIVADFVKWAKGKDIPVGPGRGSGAGSVVAWALTITDLDPLKYDLLFERFLNPERVSMPDFDIDFCQNKRDEVIQYVNKKYGNDCVAHIITFGTLASKAAIRDVGRVLEVPYSEVDKFAKLIPYNAANPISLKDSINSDKNIIQYIKNDDRIANIVETSLKLEGLHRHASTHAAGVVIGDKDLINNVPLYKDPNTSVNATQFSMKYVEKAGLIKFDFLGLTTLSVIQDTIKLIKENNPTFELEKISMKDNKTFNQLSKGDAVGVFQLESSGMSNVLKQLQPDRFEDIIAVVALFRPGPMDNIKSFCNRKHKREKIDYIHPILKPILQETYGIIVYQEQVMQIAQVLSNYSLSEADLLRRAMGKKIQKEMDAQKNRFIEGAKINNIDEKQAAYIFDLVDKFAGYGFNKSHAAGYALLAYQTAFLKSNFPHEFITASLNYSIDRTDKIILLKKELDKLNIHLKKPDVNFSESKFIIEKDIDGHKNIRFALGAIKGVGIASMNNLVIERKNKGKFNTIIDFMNRLKGDVVNKRQLEKLIQAGSFDAIEKNRKKLFDNVEKFIQIYGGLKQNKNDQSLLFEENNITFEDKNLFKQNISEWSTDLLLKNELDVVGFYFSNHPLTHYPKDFFSKLNIKNFNDFFENNDVKNSKIVGSILDIKERSNREGKKYAFLTISNIDSQFEVSIFNDVLLNYKDLLKEGNLLLFDIDISRDNENTRLVVRKVTDFSSFFRNTKYKINLYLSNVKDMNLIEECIRKKTNNNNNLYIFFNKDDKLISLDFSKEYEISDFIKIDKLNEARKIDYSLEIQ